MKSSCYCSDVLGPRTEAQRCFKCPMRTTTIDTSQGRVDIVASEALGRNEVRVYSGLDQIEATRRKRKPSLRHCEAVLSLATTSAMWFNDAYDWYEALATVMNERAPA